MKIDKSLVIDQLKKLGQHDQAARADAELPSRVNTKRDSGMLGKFGIDPSMLGQLGKSSGLLGKAKGMFRR